MAYEQQTCISHHSRGWEVQDQEQQQSWASPMAVFLLNHLFENTNHLSKALPPNTITLGIWELGFPHMDSGGTQIFRSQQPEVCLWDSTEPVWTERSYYVLQLLCLYESQSVHLTDNYLNPGSGSFLPTTGSWFPKCFSCIWLHLIPIYFLHLARVSFQNAMSPGQDFAKAHRLWADVCIWTGLSPLPPGSASSHPSLGYDYRTLYDSDLTEFSLNSVPLWVLPPFYEAPQALHHLLQWRMAWPFLINTTSCRKFFLTILSLV
jgi:hypothetical protein